MGNHGLLIIISDFFNKLILIIKFIGIEIKKKNVLKSLKTVFEKVYNRVLQVWEVGNETYQRTLQTNF